MFLFILLVFHFASEDFLQAEKIYSSRMLYLYLLNNQFTIYNVKLGYLNENQYAYVYTVIYVYLLNNLFFNL